MKAIILASLIIMASGCKHSGENAMPPYFDRFEEGVQEARKSGRPILLIFDWWGNPTGSSFNVLASKDVQKELIDYTIIFLMVDDETKVENGYTLGQTNAELQAKMGLKNQPCYLKLTTDLSRIGAPQGYMNENEFIRFLRD